MTINEIAETLTRCAEGRCGECDYKCNRHSHSYQYPSCMEELVKQMGAEVRKIAEKMEEQKDDI